MNSKSLLCACAAAAAMMIAAMPAMATTTPTTKTNVPFAFFANGKQMPAGQYVMGRNSENVMSLRSEEGSAALALVTSRVGSFNGISKPKLVFVKKNGKYHLSEVHLGATGGGEKIPVK